MPRFELDLRLDVSVSKSDDEPVELSEESQRVRARIYKQLGLKAHSGKAWVTLDLESAKVWGVVQKLVEECRSGHVVVGSATAREKLDTDGDWFLLVTKPAYDSFSLWDD